MKTQIFKICFFAIIAFLSVSCQKAAEQKTANEPPKTQSSDTPAVKVEIKTEPEFIEAGKEVEISLTIKNNKDEVIKDLAITHEKPMHLIAVSQDLEEFYHLHPEPAADGSYKIKHTFPAGGRYTLFLDLTLPGGKQEGADNRRRRGGQRASEDGAESRHRVRKNSERIESGNEAGR